MHSLYQVSVEAEHPYSTKSSHPPQSPCQCPTPPFTLVHYFLCSGIVALVLLLLYLIQPNLLFFRCVRFAEEVAGVEDLGVTGRGNASEVSRPYRSLPHPLLFLLQPLGTLSGSVKAFAQQPQ